MERITKWDGDVPAYNGSFTGEPMDDMHPAWKAVHRHWRPIGIHLEVMRRLAEYEDTGLTPEEITALKDMTGEHLLALKREELDNKLVHLPVAVDGNLYVPAASEYGPTAIRGIIQEIYVYASRHAENPYITLKVEVDGKVYKISDDLIGKSFFLTMEEAVKSAKGEGKE